MRAPSNYDNVKPQTGGFEKPQAGGYVLRCVGVEETESQKSGNPMLVIDFDIATGPFKNNFKTLHDKFGGKWGLRYYQLLTDKQAGRYKGVVESFRKSNDVFSSSAFTGEEHKTAALVNKQVGAVLREEEYEKRDGSIGSGLKIFYLCSVDTISKGEFKIPEKKKADSINIEESPSNAPFNNSLENVDLDDLPF